jgi:O-antigen ligase
MAFAFSQTGYFALFTGLVILCALRWSFKWTAIATAALLAVAAIAIVVNKSSVEVDRGKGSSNIDETTSGRSRLVSGGFDLFKAHPAQGFGSGSFAQEFADRHDLADNEAAVSHTEPVTVAAEQGIVGVLVYLAVLAASVFALLAGLRRVAPGFGGKAPPDVSRLAAAIAIAAAYGGLLIHTLGYAGFLTDPLTWALLAVGSALATLRT